MVDITNVKHMGIRLSKNVPLGKIELYRLIFI